MLLAAYKPPNISSNAFLSRLKKQFHCQKGGFLGTLDPFAQGTLIIGFNQYTRLFPHLSTAPKTYRALLWLGVESESLDIERISNVKVIESFTNNEIITALDSLKGEISYIPPRFSAKKINGKRAYKLAREGISFTPKASTMTIYDIKLLHYMHPFIKFEVSISSGGYVRSIGEMIAKKLHTNGALSFLERVSEGGISVSKEQNLKILNPLDYLPYRHLAIDSMEKLKKTMLKGQKFTLKNIQKGKYIVRFDEFFSIIEILENGEAKYILNRIAYADTLTQTR